MDHKEEIYTNRYPSGQIHNSLTVGDPADPRTLEAFDYGFIESISGPLRPIIDGGSYVRWKSSETIMVDGSLSYDSDVGPGSHAEVNFIWSCADSADNTSKSYDCFGAFTNENLNATTIGIDTSKLSDGKTYVLRLTLTKDKRNASADMSFEIAVGEIPRVTLR